MESTLTRDQKITTGWKMISPTLRMRVFIRYDDDCGNGHNTFSITGEIQEKRGNNRFYDYSGGCIHDEIEKYFPEYSHLIKWHLVSSDGPMHYIANTTYHASDKDHDGKRKGDVSRYTLSLKFCNFPMTFNMPLTFLRWVENLGSDDIKNLVIEKIEHKNDPTDSYKFPPKYTFQGFVDRWHNCPFDTEQDALEFKEALKLGFEVIRKPVSWSEGKKRDLDAARSCAVWPDATDDEMMSDDLKEKLIARLPALLSEFKKDIEALGFMY